MGVSYAVVAKAAAVFLLQAIVKYKKPLVVYNWCYAENVTPQPIF